MLPALQKLVLLNQVVGEISIRAANVIAPSALSDKRHMGGTAGQFLAHGANPNLLDKNGETTLQRAQKEKRLDIVGLLKQHGAK